ncbi:MAG: hypothetical protein H6Q25_1289 [Bacteroidetes bacterium]|nr:hypothetical protein [Bacteroidota bacterium]
MKKLFILMLTVFLSTFWISNLNALAQSGNSKVVTVYYFHSTNRCATCNAVENVTKTVLNEQYKDQVSKGLIVFKSINIDEDVNKNLVNKYKIVFSTLLIINANGTTNDFTDTAFQYAKTNPEKYKELLKVEINKALK